MIDNYKNDQNISNNIIIQKSNESNKQKRIFISSEKSMSYSSSVDDKNETIDNQINDSTSSFDYSDTLRVSEIPKSEKPKNLIEKSKNLLAFLSKAVTENFDFFNLPRKTHIEHIYFDKNRKISNSSDKKASGGDKLKEKLKKYNIISSNEKNNNNYDRIRSPKSLKNNFENKTETKVINLTNKGKEIIKGKNIKIISNKISNRNKNNIICRNININLNSRNSNSLNNINTKKKNSNTYNELNKINKNGINKIKNQQPSKISKEIKINEKNNQRDDKNKKELNKTSIDDFQIKNNNLKNNQYKRLTYIETPSIKNINITPRLTVTHNCFHNNMSSQNIFQNKTKQIKLDIKCDHIQSKSPKRVLVKKIFPQENNAYKQNLTNNNLINKQLNSPNSNKFGRKSEDIKTASFNSINNNHLMNSVNDIKKINGDINLIFNHINIISNQNSNNQKTKDIFDNQEILRGNNLNNQNGVEIFNVINSQISPNQLIKNFQKGSKPINSQQRLTISTPSINNLKQNEYSSFSPRLTNIQNQPQTEIHGFTQKNNEINQINANIQLNQFINNYNDYILSEDTFSTAQKDFNVTYNSFDPTGVLKNYGILTLPGKDTSGKQKTNQDSFTFITNIKGIKNFNIFGVLDGHGVQGHFVSQFASKYIPNKIINSPEIKNMKDTELIYNHLKSNNYQIIVRAYIECDMALQNANFDSKESGCTCNLIINIGNHIICANTGDSRAISIFTENNEWGINYKYIPLSIDFKPEMPEEMNRIIINGGEVRQIKNEFGEGVGPFRVWKRGEGYPGLAMSRSIGDLNGKKLGVIPNPGIIEYQLDKNSKYIVVCSDGVWEFLDNKNVKDIGIKYYLNNDPSGFCHELVNTSFCLWEKNDIVIDDITAVVAFF